MSETAHKILADISEELTGRLHEKGTLSMTEAMGLVDETLGTSYTRKSYDDYILADPDSWIDALYAIKDLTFGVDLGKEEAFRPFWFRISPLWTETQHRVRPIDIRKGGWGR